MKNVLIIGANCDIGKAITRYFLDKEYNLVLGYHNDNNEYFKQVKYMKCDVTSSESIKNIIKYCIDTYGKIDVIINLACVCMYNSFLNKTKEELMKEIEINLVGMFLCNQIYSRYVNDGMIINMASTDGIDAYVYEAHPEEELSWVERVIVKDREAWRAAVPWGCRELDTTEQLNKRG